mgnify:FL=1
MRINITAGECLKDILQAIYPDEEFVPFNEAMIQGTYKAVLFSDEFIKERSIVHKVTEEQYRENMSGFLHFLDNLNDYDEIVLWFGNEPFCRCNRDTVLKILNKYKYNGNVLLHIVDEETG